MKKEIKPYYTEVLKPYYENNAKKINKMVDGIFRKNNWTAKNGDMDEFYLVADEVLSDIAVNDRYDESKGSFDTFVKGALTLAIIDEFKKQNRDKRITKIDMEVDGEIVKVSIPDVYLDAPTDDEESTSIKDLIPSNFDTYEELERKSGEIYSENTEKYLSSLSKVQRKILIMLADGYQQQEIKEELHLTNSQYESHWKVIKSFSKIKTLFKNDIKDSEEDDENMNTVTQTMENCKTDKISVASVIKKIDKNVIRFNHSLQRESDQWSPAMKGNLVSDMLQGNKLHPLIFAEQIINGVPIIWDLDGKQRCTNAYSFARDGYKVSKNIRRWLVRYQTTVKDENGNDVLDENGFPIAKNEEFDIRGKKFSDLPEELQERFLDYTFNYDQYLNCSDDDIGYHIERYNDGKPMTAAQKGITKLGTAYAELVKSISNMSFFKDLGGYKSSEFRNGTINRVVVESIMAANYISDWKKDQDSQCKYLKDNADISAFDDFEDLISRLEKVITDEVAEMFDSKDSFLWFGLFSRFIKTGLSDEKFIEFMVDFPLLHDKEVDGMTYDKLCIDPKTGKTRSTKDKYIVVPKLDLMEKLMLEFLGLSDMSKGEPEEINVLEFVKENVNTDITEESIKEYEEDLEVLTLNVNNESRLMNIENRPSLIAMVAYGYLNDIEIDDWIVDYFNNNSMYMIDQKKNYLHMKDNLDEYIAKTEAA